MKPARLSLVASLLAGLAGTAQGQEPEPVDACILGAFAAQANPAACLVEVHAECMSTPAETPAVATLCFRRAREDWDGRITGIMRKIGTEREGPIAAIAGIEVKYDLLSGLLQCDRVEELALAISDLGTEEIAREKARCAATAAGLAYARLLWRARDPG